MDFKKLYKEALERAKQGLPIDEVFPELKESEDERIRKEIVELIKNNYGCLRTTRDKELALAYLEKQKEKKPSSYSNLEITNVVRKALQECEGFNNCRPDVYAARVGATVESLLQEQQPAEWSEEDENKIESIKGLITTGKFVDTNTIRTIWKLLDSLRPQPHWKPSEKQVGALEQWLKDKQYDGDSRYIYPILESLCNDLQKLL